MTNKRISFGENTNIVLINQVDGVCPLCDLQLVYEKSGRKYKDYEIAHIFPLNPTLEELSLLENEERLSTDVNSDDNLIPLCRDCHIKFDKPRTVEEYRSLVKIKRKLISDMEHRNLWHQFDIERDIEKIIDGLNDEDILLDVDDITYEPKTVDNKTDETLSNVTKRKIKSNVADYYPFIKRKLALIDSENPGVAEIIATQIKLYYLKLRQNRASQQEIYNNIVEWVYKKTKAKSKDAADIIVSFFIQNCEVFE